MHIVTQIISKIPHTSVELRWYSPLAGVADHRARQLRGAFAKAFPDDSRFHQYDGEGNQLYRYPQIQYRWKNGYGIVEGWHTGADTLLNVHWLDLPLRLGDNKMIVSDAVISTQSAQFGVSSYLIYYNLVSPVLLFNQDNYKKYQKLEKAAQQYERDRLLVAQLLAAMDGLGIRFETQLYAAFTQIKIYPCRYKNQNMIGITGSFATNAIVPCGFAIGHAVSHGYGWIVPANKIEDNKSQK
jgi:hypothetical protein